MTDDRKPLGIKAYGHIGHLPGSRVGPGDHLVNDGQAQICVGARSVGDRTMTTRAQRPPTPGMLAVLRYLSSNGEWECHGDTYWCTKAYRTDLAFCAAMAAMKRRGLIETEWDDDQAWYRITDAGRAVIAP